MIDPPYRIKNMVPGMIMLWHGAVVDIPSGWHLCDGNMGTPDLRTRFIYGAGGALAPGQTGGNNQHTHDFAGDGHRHDLLPGTGEMTGPDVEDTTTFAAAVGTTDVDETVPPYHALCFIMKL